MWIIIGTKKPSKNDANRDKARLAFQKLWVAGTLGAFFVALAKNIPLHIAQFSFEPDLIYTLNVILEYSYLLWFLCYFYISNLRNEQEPTVTNNDLIFDIGQSIAALATAYTLGFIVPTIDLGFKAYLVANGAILFISLLSLAFYSKGASEGVNRIRCFVAIAAFFSIATLLVFWNSWQASDIAPHLILLAFSVFLWLMLWLFVFIRLDREGWT